MFNFNIETKSTKTDSKVFFPVPDDFMIGVAAKLVKYEFTDNRAVFTFEAENGGQTKRTVFDPTTSKNPNKAEHVANNLKYLALYTGIELPKDEQASTWEEFCNKIFANKEFTDNQVRLKVGYAKEVMPYDPSKFEGKTQEEIKKLYHPYINISSQDYWVADNNSQKPFQKFNEYDKVYTDFELVETLPSTSDDLPFDEVKLPDLDFTASDTPDVIF